MMTPMSVSVFGWTRSATHRPMMARSGYMHAAPMTPVKVVRCGGSTLRPAGWRKMVGSGTDEKRAIVAYAHPGTQGSDCEAARAARSLSVFQCGGRHHLRGQGARAA